VEEEERQDIAGDQNKVIRCRGATQVAWRSASQEGRGVSKNETRGNCEAYQAGYESREKLWTAANIARSTRGFEVANVSDLAV